MIEIPAEVPEELVPVDDLYISLGAGKEMALRRYRARLHGCPERPAISLDRAYSAKPLVMVEKQAMFPELAVLTFFRRKGWEGAWVDASHRKFFDRMPNQSKGISLGAHASQILARIGQYSDKGREGCWDLVLWADRTVAFAAVIGKEAGKEAGRPGQAVKTAQAGKPAGKPAQAGKPTQAGKPRETGVAALLGEARTRWLGAAVKSGMSAVQFAVVEWEFQKVAARRKGR